MCKLCDIDKKTHRSTPVALADAFSFTADVRGCIYGDYQRYNLCIKDFTITGKEVAVRVDYCPMCGRNLWED